MSDTDIRTESRTQSQGFSDQLHKASEEIKQRVSEAATTTGEAAHETLGDIKAGARETASKVAEKANEEMIKRQHAGADFVLRFSENIRTAAKAFEKDTPIASRLIEMTAGYLEDAADTMRDKSAKEMFNDGAAFARQHPAAFLGISVLAGFAAVRFLKASGGGTKPQRFSAFETSDESQYQPSAPYGSEHVNDTQRRKGRADAEAKISASQPAEMPETAARRSDRADTAPGYEPNSADAGREF